MDGATARVTVQLSEAATGASKLVREAVPVVGFWLERWSDLAESAVAGPTTIVLAMGAGEVEAGADEVVVRLDEAEVGDADSARMLVLTAVLDGLAQACLDNPRTPTREVGRGAADVPTAAAEGEGLESFGAGEMSVFIHLAGHAELDQDAAFDEFDGILEDRLRGVALLQDSTVVNGFGQWVIGRPDG